MAREHVAATFLLSQGNLISHRSNTAFFSFPVVGTGGQVTFMVAGAPSRSASNAVVISSSRASISQCETSAWVFH